MCVCAMSEASRTPFGKERVLGPLWGGGQISECPSSLDMVGGALRVQAMTQD